MSSIAEQRRAMTGPAPYRPGFLRAPFSGQTWRETLHLVLDLPIGVVMFSLTAVLFFFGVGTAMTFIGLPVLAALMGMARGFGAMERARSGALLGQEVAGPAPLVPNRPGMMAWMGALLKNGANWRAVLYGVLMLPMGILGFTLAVVLWSVGISAALYPAYHWVFPRYVGWPGYKLWDYDNHSYYIHTVPEIAATCAVGIVLVLLTPQVLRGIAAVRRAMARGLLR
ncbi:sensor domain-containing protein [Streptacidiphilus fuscans]|uniref:Sensor domain-containing protein n=1 Tax=Streptacidiphilus fuscans TaxID=2789292 RepID=A0A931FAT9_9ACTN|nr:sensor domain-containing protein [Streptacidiphilus fuscans]MBF9067982.1 sensor domain-containing protein [Streptacidiphilus fuscans]